MVAQRVKHRPADVLQAGQSSLNALAERVRLLDPRSTMARGWSITRNASGVVVRDVTNLKVGDTLVTTFSAGSTSSTIKEISTKGNKNGEE